MEANPRGNPYNSGIIIDSDGELRLYYRKLHPWVPVEPWAPGDLGIPVCEGPNGSTLALIICHDGMFPEMARECAYKGADVIIRTAGYTAPIRHAWQITNQANAFCNLAYTASVCLCGSDATFDSMGEAMIVGYDGVALVTGGAGPTRSWWGRCAPIWSPKPAASGAWRTIRTSSATAVTWRSTGGRGTAPTPTWRTW
jgi:formamidase